MQPLTVALYPQIEAHDRGLLAVSDGNAISWEVSGSPKGKAAVVLHGGPGQGSSPNMRRAFDPEKYRVILFDQRGCGRSTPHASDPATEMRFNTTERLIADMEALREHLGVDRWLVSGGSWGAALAVAYAEQHPSRVSALVLNTVTTARRSEAAWLYGGLARIFPEAAEQFRRHVPEARDGDVIAAYARRMEHPDRSVRLLAARAWCAWEEAALSLEPAGASGPFSTLSAEDAIAFTRICTHYLRHGAWLAEGALIRDAGRLSGIPGVLVHGRRDLACPVDTAYLLARAWPGSRLIVLDDAGHLGSDSKRRALLNALDGFALR
ncbi:MAG TPA: prolyl aminopeptidase [Planctomycetota bacterium]|nr:prolyl aminopeptidase [Planctomycetota bacterium]